MKMTKYEAWEGDGIYLLPQSEVQEHMNFGLIEKDARLLYVIEAATWEEASAIHNLRMGWGLYNPQGDPKKCPNNCGCHYYPKGSGRCALCGDIE